jgi:sirohydrochlorin ferrochelatase
VGLSAWPTAPLRRTLLRLAGDLDPALAAAAVDLLARLPAARGSLRTLAREPLDPAVAARLQRRLARLPATPLLLVVHGRAGGAIPVELSELAEELEHRRGAPVRLQALTAERPPELPTSPASPLMLVPLFLLPGGHVRRDLPAIATSWAAQGPLRRLPFLGAWPAWQRALAAEVEALAAGAAGGDAPALLHHPLEGPLPARYLAHLSGVTGAVCRAAPYSADAAESLPLPGQAAVLPLALAANRLTDTLPERLGPPLLRRKRFRHLLVQILEDLP